MLLLYNIFSEFQGTYKLKHSGVDCYELRKWDIIADLLLLITNPSTMVQNRYRIPIFTIDCLKNYVIDGRNNELWLYVATLMLS